MNKSYNSNLVMSIFKHYLYYSGYLNVTRQAARSEFTPPRLLDVSQRKESNKQPTKTKKGRKMYQ
jgi:hypothetical protein